MYVSFLILSLLLLVSRGIILMEGLTVSSLAGARLSKFKHSARMSPAKTGSRAPALRI